MILGVVLLLSSAVYTECFVTKEKHRDTGVKSMVPQNAEISPVDAATIIDKIILRGIDESQVGFLHLRDKTDKLLDFKDKLKENTDMWFVEDMALIIALAIKGKRGKGKGNFNNYNHAENRLLPHLTGMGDSFISKNSKCPETVILGTVDPRKLWILGSEIFEGC